jgi:hypothetical protein
MEVAMRAIFLLLFFLPPLETLWAEDVFRTETEIQSAPGLERFGVSQFFWFTHKPAPNSRFGFGANVRYYRFSPTNRGEFTASGTMYLKTGFINLNPGRTTDGRYTTAVVLGYRWGKWSALALADPKWRHSATRPNTIFSKGTFGRGPLHVRAENFHVAGNRVSSYLGVEFRQKFANHYEVFGAPMISWVGKNRFVLQFGLRTNWQRNTGKTK